MEHQYGHDQNQDQSHAEHGAQRGGADCQITRSSAKWSHNISTEVSLSLVPRLRELCSIELEKYIEDNHDV